MKDNVVTGNFKQEKADIVYVCNYCDGDEFKLLEDGRIKCADCKFRSNLPPDFIDRCQSK